MKRKILKMLTAFSFAAVLTTSFSAVGVANAKNEQSDEISCAANIMGDARRWYLSH